jgi:hypothetical protein
MTPENFGQILSAFNRRRPWRPFTLELVNGSRIEVNHPEALTLALKGTVITFRSTTKLHTVFECAGVIRFLDATGTG